MQYQVTITKDDRACGFLISASHPRVAVSKALRLLANQSWRLGAWRGNGGTLTIAYTLLTAAEARALASALKSEQSS